MKGYGVFSPFFAMFEYLLYNNIYIGKFYCFAHFKESHFKI